MYPTAQEESDFATALNRAALRRILTTEFALDGQPKGIEPDLVAWAVDVVRRRPAWAESVLNDLGIQPPSLSET